MDPNELTQQRMDFVEHPDGSVDAILTISLGKDASGQPIFKRYTAHSTAEELEAISGDIVGAELAMADPSEVGSIFSAIAKGLGKAVKGVAKGIRKVASSKVLGIAAKGLKFLGPVLPGPIGVAATAAGAGLGVAQKLAQASIAAERGAKSVAKSLTGQAAAAAKKLTKTPAGAASLLKYANKKRIGVEALATKSAAKARPPKAPAKKPAAKPAAPASSNDILARARAGRVRSNQGGPVSSAQLMAAHKSGRVFWLT